MQIRDVILRQQSKFETKQDRQMFRRAVLTTEGGLQTSSDPLNDVWANRNERRVWHMADGATQPAQVLCRKVSNPYVGLGVIIGYADGSNAKEVLTTDFFLTGAGTNLDGWDDTGPEDLEPGGNKLHWVYTKVITPLATYPDPTGLTVNVISGDYPYLGTRKTFAGSVSYALTQNPNAGQHYLAGLYLDAANTLQVVYGTSVSTATTAPEPSWPAGAFRLSAVLIDDVQTSIDFDTDIFDRRLAWSDGQATSGWPFAKVLTVSTTDPDADYSTIAAALAAVAAYDTILLDSLSSYAENVTISEISTLASFSDLNAINVGTGGSDTYTVTNFAGHSEIRDMAIENTGAGTESGALKIDANEPILMRRLRLDKSLGNPTTGNALKLVSGGSHTIDNCQITCASGTNKYAINVTGAVTATIIGGIINGTTADIRVNDAGATITLLGPQLLGGGISVAAGTVKGFYYDSTGNLHFVNATGHNSGVWLVDESATLRKYYSSFANANTAAADGDTIFLDSDTYAITTGSITKSITIAGNGPEATILQGSNGANAQLLDIAADSITVVFKDLTIDCNAGDGTYGGAIFGDNSGITVILDNAVVKKTGGAPTNGFGIGPAAGTWILRNGAKASATVGTNKYGIFNITGAATITVGAGCEVTGATQDIYSDQSGSTITLNSAILTNALASVAGKLNWEPENKIGKNLLYSSMTHNLWQEGTTLNDLADDTYGPDTVWNVLNKSNAPDISGQAGGATDPFTTSFRCTFDANTEQAGIVQFLEAADTIPLRGQVVSLSADLWGTNVSTLRMAVIVWTSTADAVTSDVVGTWAAGNPTLATNWAYIGTPAAITITSTRTRYAVNNLTVPTNANNIAVFIWTDATESSGDLWEVARVQLERGPVATEFVTRRFNEELLLVSQFYQKSYDLATTPGTNTLVGSGRFQTRTAIAATTAGNLHQSTPFPVKMFKSPVVSVYSTNGAANAVRNASAGNDRTGVTIVAGVPGQGGFSRFDVDNSSANAIALDAVITYHFVADARF